MHTGPALSYVAAYTCTFPSQSATHHRKLEPLYAAAPQPWPGSPARAIAAKPSHLSANLSLSDASLRKQHLSASSQPQSVRRNVFRAERHAPVDGSLEHVPAHHGAHPLGRAHEEQVARRERHQARQVRDLECSRSRRRGARGVSALVLDAALAARTVSGTVQMWWLKSLRCFTAPLMDNLRRARLRPVLHMLPAHDAARRTRWRR